MIERDRYAMLCARSIQKVLSLSEPESEKDMAIALTIMAEVTLTILRAMIGKEHMAGLIDEIKEHVLDNDSKIEVHVMKMGVREDKPTEH